MTRLRRFLVTSIASIVIVGGVAAMISRPAPVAPKGGGRFSGGDGAVPVRIAPAIAADVPVYLDTVGTARALSTVAVQPQVGGKLVEVLFREGQTVKKGEVVARIDPSTYEAALQQAKAKVEQDEAQLANAKMDLERYIKIPGAIPIKTVDTQRALVAQLTGQVASSKAAVEASQVQLAYTNIVAPATGRTGIRQVDEGNIVMGSAGMTIVTITQVQPIAVIFNLPQQQLAQVNRAAAKATVVVEATEADNRTLVDRGTLQVVDNQVDQMTGTVRMKAEFPNSDLQLWPGQFVNVRVLIETLPQAVTVPTAAVQRGPNGPFVYIAGADNKVAARVVTVPQQDDVRAVLASGVESGERVVTTGFARLKEGTEVAAVTTEELNAAPVAPKRESPRGEGRRKREGGGAPQTGASSATPSTPGPGADKATTGDGSGAGQGGGQGAGEGGKRHGNGEGRRRRQEAAPSAEAPGPATPAPPSADSNGGAPGKRADKAPQAAAQ